MAVTITDQRTIISDADATTGWTGSNTVTLFTTEPTAIESTGCLGMVVSNTTQNAYVTVTSINFTTDPSLIYVWIFHRAELDTRANGGLMIQLGDGTNRVGYHVAGSDVAAFRHDSGPTGWQCLVLDTANRPAAFTTFAGSEASLNMGAITQIGVGFKTLVKAVGGVANCFWDIMRRGSVGQGLQITGGTSGDPGTWEQVAAADRTTGNQQAYGVVRKLGEGLFGVQGPLTFGNSTSGATWFEDTGVTVVFEERGQTSNKYGITIQGNGTSNTTFILGSKTGTGDDTSGADGCVLAVPTSTSAYFHASSSNLQDFALYGCQIVGFGVDVTLSDDATNGPGHEIAGTIFRNCGPVSVNRTFVRNCEFTGYTLPTSASLLWNENIDIKNCSFVNNTSGSSAAAIQHSTNASSPYIYNGLTFSGNDYDIRYSAPASSGDLEISSVGGSNPSTYVITNATGNTVTIVNNIAVTLTNLKDDTEVRVYSAGTTTELAGIESAIAGTADNRSFTFTLSAGVNIDIRIHKVTYETTAIYNFTIPASDTSIPISQRFDRNYSNP